MGAWIIVSLTKIIVFYADLYPLLAGNYISYKQRVFTDWHMIPHLLLESIPLEKTSWIKTLCQLLNTPVSCN